MTLRVSVGALGGTIPSDLPLSASRLPDGTTISLTSVLQEGSEAVLTVEVAHADQSQAVNATALIKLISGDTTLTGFNVPVVGMACDGSF